MTSKRSQEGWLMIDDRASGGLLVEQATFTCAHCQRVTPLDPLRQRPRGYCAGCDRYLCDQPACNGQCRPMSKLLDRAQELAARNLLTF